MEAAFYSLSPWERVGVRVRQDGRKTLGTLTLALSRRERKLDDHLVWHALGA